ncbi:MAG: GvpL/GvpF family gas vesicle protein [Mariniphaga sp.]|nr:GvpL/GvpF family gas vesicle protein [Mariniphaga sp.]
MTNNLIYVYCLSNSPPELAHDIEPKGLKSLIFDNFYVIIKYVSESEFSEENFKKNLSDIQWVETNAREHIKVISKIMETGTVIPFKFGTIFNARSSLKKFVADYSDSLHENFLHIEGKEEWSVKIYCDRKSLSEQIDELSEEAASLEKQIMASSPGKAFLLKKKKNDLIENEMDRLCKKYGQEFYDDFKNLSEETSLNNLLPKDFTGREDFMILNAAFLVSKNRLTDFKNLVDTLIKKDENSSFCIEANGPWPPFSFISIKEKM